MFCTKCGNKVDDNDLFCSKCGNKIKSVNLEQKNIKNDKEEWKLKFEFGVSFNQNQCKELLIRSIFEHNASKSYYDFRAYCIYEINDFDEIYNEATQKFDYLLKSNIDIAVNALIELGVDYVDNNTIYSYIKDEIEKDEKLDLFYKPLNDLDALITKLSDEKKLRESYRSPWRGGGFGFKGAIKGAMKASVLNADQILLAV